MNARELLACLERSRMTHGKPEDLFWEAAPLQPAGLDLTTEQVTTAEQVRAALVAFEPRAGWLCLQSAVCRFGPDEPLPDDGVILYGEVCRDDTTALHIRQAAGGGWLLTTYRRVPGEEGYLMDEVKQLVEPGRGGGWLRYRRYWACPAPGVETWHGLEPDPEAAREIPGDGWLPVAAQFIGFEPQEGRE